MYPQPAGRRRQIQRIAADLKFHRRAGRPLWRWRFRLRSGKLVVADDDSILHMNRYRVLRMFFIQRSIHHPGFRGARYGSLDGINPPILPARLSTRDPSATDQYSAHQHEDDEQNALHSAFQFTGLDAPSRRNRTPLTFSPADR